MNERFSLDIATLTNSTIAQLRVEELNSVLQENSTTLGAKLISNDTSFRLADGLPNDGYLSADGLHLNYRGTNRLATKHRLIRLDIYFLLGYLYFTFFLVHCFVLGLLTLCIQVVCIHTCCTSYYLYAYVFLPPFPIMFCSLVPIILEEEFDTYDMYILRFKFILPLMINPTTVFTTNV